MYSTYTEGKSVVAERFIRTLKSKIFKHATAVSKNVYFNKYNNTVHKTIKMNPIDVTSDSYVNTMKIQMKKILNAKLVIMSKFQNTKTLFLRDTLQIGHNKFLLLAKLKMQFRGLILLVT